MTFALQNVSVVRGDKPVLTDVTLALTTGSIIGVIGPNGAGKSTLLGALAGDLAISQGSLTLADMPLPPLSQTDLARRRAVMAQQSAAIFNLNVRQVLELGLFAFEHWTAHERGALLIDVAATTGVDRWLDDAMTARSVGEQQRVHFTRAVLQARAALQETGSAWLLLDEPSANQDPAHQQAMMQTCRRLLESGPGDQRSALGVVVVMHDLSLAAQWCDELIVLKNGAVLNQGPVGEVLTPETIHEAFGQQLGVRVHRDPSGVIVYTPD